jgi:alpha-amylase
MAVGFMLAHPYGFTRVMSSYRWQRNIQNGQVSLKLLKVSFSQEMKVPVFNFRRVHYIQYLHIKCLSK